MDEQELDLLYELLHKFKTKEISCKCSHVPKCRYKGAEGDCHILSIMEDAWIRREEKKNGKRQVASNQ